MSNLEFDDDGYLTLSTKYHGEVTLSRGKWEKICQEPERLWYKFNGEKIPTTLVNPDYIRYHEKKETQIIYYKEFHRHKLSKNIEVPTIRAKFFAVVIDTKTSKVCTVFPVVKPKKGKEFKPEEKKDENSQR
jgi:hypothetical protein